MRKFIRDVVLRSAEIIKERERKAQAPDGPFDLGQPSACMFCEDRPQIIIVQNGRQAFLCPEHLAPFVIDWTTAHELTLVRL
jgi:hypothetical protein